MPTVVQFRRGTTTQNENFTGADGEISIDTQVGTLRVHNGIDQGGSNIASVAYVDTALSSLSSNSIADGTTNFSIIATNGNIRGNVAGATITNIHSGGLEVTGVIGGVATSARYADLAENYLADSFYNAGTVVEFGGNTEVTISSISHSTAVAGIVSTAPAYLMNSHLEGEHVVAVALTGRVPCAVQGPVKKGTVLVSGIVPGTAMAIDSLKFEPGCIIGKSMDTIETTEIQTIEVAVGRL